MVGFLVRIDYAFIFFAMEMQQCWCHALNEKSEVVTQIPYNVNIMTKNSATESKNLHWNSPNDSTHKLRDIREGAYYIDLNPFRSTFESSLLIFRGDTTIFDFQQIQHFKIPFIHISFKQVKDEIQVYANAKARNLSTNLNKSVRSQVVVHGLSTKTRYLLTRYEVLREGKTVMPVHPLTLLVVTTESICWKSLFNGPGDIFEAYGRRARPTLFVFVYEVSTFSFQEAYVLCAICQYKSHLEVLSSPPDVLPGEGLPTDYLYLQFYPVHEIPWDMYMSVAQKNISYNGRNIIWKLENLRNPQIGDKPEEKQVENQDFIGKLKRTILGANNFKQAVINSLLPSLDDKRREAITNGDRSNRCPWFSFNHMEVEDEDIVFITSNRIKDLDGKATVEVLLYVFDDLVWEIIFLTIGLTSLMHVILKFQLNPWSASTKSSVPTKFQDFISIVAYIWASCVGQFPHDLPLRPSEGNYLSQTRLMVVPWLLGTLLLSNWYTAFLSSSYNFIFPYELEIESWRDFENFSLYVMINPGIEVLMRGNNNVSADWNDEPDRRLLELDVKNFVNGTNTTEPLLDLSYTPPHSDSMPLIFYTELKQTELSRKFDNEIRKHGPIHWLRTRWETALLSYVRNRCGHKIAEENNFQCLKDAEMMKKMQLRTDIIHFDELSMYVGKTYDRRLVQARQAGLKHIEDLGDAYVLEIDEYYVKSRKSDQIEIEGKDSKPNTFYWMTRRQEAVFVTTKSIFPWHWNLFKSLMNQDKSLKFAHTGPKHLKDFKFDKGLGGSGFESPVQIQGSYDKYLPEMEWMLTRIRAFGHSGIMGFLAKWDLILNPPTNQLFNQYVEESETGFQALTMAHDSITAPFKMYTMLMCTAFVVLLIELSISALIYPSID